MASTQDILNKVLIGLRQTQITATSTTDAYELLLLQLVNEAKEEVEESWDWFALRETHTVTLAASTSEYTLTIAGDSDKDTTERTKLLYERSPNYGRGEGTSRTFGDTPQVFDTTDSSEYRLAEVSQEAMERFHFMDDDETSDPRFFSIFADGTSLKLKVYPTPSGVRTIKIRFLNPQAELASTALTTTTLKVPFRPVWQKALFKANEERGSELGRPQSSLDNAQIDSLSVAISREQTEVDITGYPV